MPIVKAGNVVIEDWNDDTRQYTAWEMDGTLKPSTEENPNPRPYTDEENAEADMRVSQEQTEYRQQILSDELAAAVQNILNIQQAAVADIQTAQNLQAAAEGLSLQLASQIQQIAAWTPPAVYSASALNVVKDQIKIITERQKQIADAMAGMYAYRKANDEAVASIYQAVLWMAQKLSGELLEP